MSDLKPYIATLADGGSLTREESHTAFQTIMSGEATPTQIGGFLMSLRVKGESVDEISGAVMAMREKMLVVDGIDAIGTAIDIVGTGGDQSGSYNVSTASAFVVAGCGVPVAKHGNRALSSKSGAADTLESLGVNLECTPSQIADCINKTNIGFMFAPMHHSAMKHVGPSRVELGTRTIFNLLGPLSNPARVKNYMIGVFSPEWVEPLANVLKDLGSERAYVVHGDGLDELSISGTTHIAELRDGTIDTFTITPSDAGLPTHNLSSIKGGDASTNAEALQNLLDGESGAYRDIVLLNSAAGLIVAGKAKDLKQGVEQAVESIDSGNAKTVLKNLVSVSSGE